MPDRDQWSHYYRRGYEEAEIHGRVLNDPAEIAAKANDHIARNGKATRDPLWGDYHDGFICGLIDTCRELTGGAVILAYLA